ncbi:hypothetical protein SAMN05443634_103247 [Chishuiella changwenlii]|uniref:Uncharacterized protein n=1 Tax=Chishuiella changwenlii TaxID=1434701 RepID=A0A1M6VAI9_9FLAO|nr:hypothetical protein [Chishuiella changwenlii]GGF09889.1 hypothetical protein GCM10010984_28830 [Chishuiella changwenlii]SHK78374.1 hypothetical protein SAMN05443634_103247 [Chishuiella changwenlii]
MENPFKTIIENEKLPEKLKQKVMDDIALVKLTLDLADLIAVKYPKTISGFFGKKNKSANHRKDENKK